MNRTRIRSAVALGLISVLALGACGSDDEETTDTTASTAAPAATGDVDDTTDIAATTAVPDTEAPASTEAGGPLTVTVGSADFPESQLLAEIYAAALENNGVRVARKDPIGSRELYYQAILGNEVQLVPEYTNSLLSFVLRQDDPDASPDATNVEEQIVALKEALPPELTVGAPSTAEDKDVIVCSRERAEELGLTTIADLAENAGEIVLGAPPEFEDRAPFGLVGFEEKYGAEFKEFVPLSIGVMAENISSGEIDCGNMFSTMSAITTEGFVALEDADVIVPNEAVLPLLRTEVATPQVLGIVDQVSAGLTTEKLKALMVKIEVDGQSPLSVAQEYLSSLAQG